MIDSNVIGDFSSFLDLNEQDIMSSENACIRILCSVGVLSHASADVQGTVLYGDPLW